MPTESGSRARYEELFNEAVEKLPATQAQIEDAHQVVSAAEQAIEGYRGDFSRRGRMGQFWGHVLDCLGIDLIVPTSAQAELEEAVKRRDALLAELRYLRGGLDYYGRKLPGTHEFLGLFHNPYETPYTPYHVSFGIKSQVRENTWDVFVSGEFAELLYQTTSERKPKIRIPMPDNEAPVLLLPEGYKVRIERVGYNGMGSYDRYIGTAQWEPKFTRKAKPVNPQEFIWPVKD